MTQAERLARLYEAVVEGALELVLDPDLVAEIAGERQPADERRHETDIHRAERHEREGLGGEVLVHQRLQQLARGGAGDGEAEPLHRAGAHLYIEAGGARLEPALVEALGGVGADQQEALGPHAAHGEIADQTAALVEHRGEGDATDGRHLVGHDGREPAFGVAARDLELAVVRDLDEADGIAHGAALGADMRMGAGAAEGDLFLRRLALGREPQRVLEAAVVAPQRVLGLHAVVDGCGLQRARRRQLLVGEADAEAARVVLAHLGVGVAARRPFAVARDIHAPDVGARVAVDHPV